MRKSIFNLKLYTLVPLKQLIFDKYVTIILWILYLLYSFVFSFIRIKSVVLEKRPRDKKKKKNIVLLLMTCNIFVVSILRFELKIYNYTNIMIIK
jgi:hypothetical protein